MIETCWQTLFPYLKIECQPNNVLYYYECCGFDEVECCMKFYSWPYYLGTILCILMFIIVLITCYVVVFKMMVNCCRKTPEQTEDKESRQWHMSDEDQAIICSWTLFEKVGLI